MSYPIGVSGVTSFAWVDEAVLAVGRPNADSTQFALLSLKDGSEETVWNIPFEARIEGWVSGQLLISARRPITEEKAQEDGAWTILDELPIWEDGDGYQSKIRRQLFLCSRIGELKRISPEDMDVRIVSADSNGLAYAGYIPGSRGRTADEIRYWDGEERLLCRNCGDIRHLALGSNYAFIYGLNIESEPDAAPALMQVSWTPAKLSPCMFPGLRSAITLFPISADRGKFYVRMVMLSIFPPQRRVPPRFINCLPQVNRYA